MNRNDDVFVFISLDFVSVCADAQRTRENSDLDSAKTTKKLRTSLNIFDGIRFCFFDFLFHQRSQMPQQRVRTNIYG